MILAIDVGNTNIVVGVYSEGQKLLHHWRMNSNRATTADEYGMLLHNFFAHAKIKAQEIEGIIVSSVVPPLMTTIETWCEKYIGKKPLIVGPGIKTGLNIRYENPREVGADRIVNAIAGIELYGTPLIIIDFGTATTFDYINEKAQYIGGAISPGIEISTEALYQKAAKLPRIELVKPPSVIGRNSVASMQAGIVYGYASQVDGMVMRIQEEFGKEGKVIATGGHAELIALESRTIHEVNPWLTLQGLRIIYELNDN